VGLGVGVGLEGGVKDCGSAETGHLFQRLLGFGGRGLVVGVGGGRAAKEEVVMPASAIRFPRGCRSRCAGLYTHHHARK